MTENSLSDDVVIEQTAEKILNDLLSIPSWRSAYYDKVLQLQGSNTPPLDLIWQLFRQGGTLCFVANMSQNVNFLPISGLDVDDPNPFTNAECERNVDTFLTYCQQELDIPADNLFKLDDLYAGDPKALVIALRLVQNLLLRSSLDRVSDVGIRTSTARSSTLSTSTKSLDSDEMTMEDRVLDEIIETERSYVKDLKVLQSYKEMIETDPDNTIPSENLKSIFGNFEDLLLFQNDFLAKMEKEYSVPAEERYVGRFFVETTVKSDMSAVYSKFCFNYSTAVATVTEQAEKLSKYDIFIKESQLHWFLIKPVQRICKYPLLLRELLKHMDKEDLDYQNVVEGFEAVTKVAATVNEEYRKGENELIGEDLRNRLVGPHSLPLNALGELHYSQQLGVVINELEHEAVVYLFENYLIFCREKQIIHHVTKEKTKGIVLLTAIETITLVAVYNATKMDNYKLKCLWQEDTDVGSFFLQFASQEMMRRWFKSLIELIYRLKLVKAKRREEIQLQQQRQHAAANPLKNPKINESQYRVSNQPKSSPSKAEKMLFGGKTSKSSVTSRKGPKTVFDWMDEVMDSDVSVESDQSVEGLRTGEVKLEQAAENFDSFSFDRRSPSGPSEYLDTDRDEEWYERETEDLDRRRLSNLEEYQDIQELGEDEDLDVKRPHFFTKAATNILGKMSFTSMSNAADNIDSASASSKNKPTPFRPSTASFDNIRSEKAIKLLGQSSEDSPPVLPAKLSGMLNPSQGHAGLTATNPALKTKAKVKKDIFAWMDDVIEDSLSEEEHSAKADLPQKEKIPSMDVVRGSSRRRDSGSSQRESFLHKSLAVNELLARSMAAITMESGKSQEKKHINRLSSGRPRRRRSNQLSQSFPFQPPNALEEGTAGTPPGQLALSSLTCSCKPPINFVKISFSEFTWFVPLPGSSPEKPFHKALKEAGIQRIRASPILEKNSLLSFFRDPMKEISSMTDQLHLFFIDSHQDPIHILEEDDFLLALEDWKLTCPHHMLHFSLKL